jgi:AcrR family transcriptional regulator
MSSAVRRKKHQGPIWGRPAPGSRKPAFSREKIAATAIAIADAEGFDAVSMRRVATELGAGTMTLYHYVGSKDELVSLLADSIVGEMIVPDDELPDGWRDGMAEIARRTLAIFRRHPWVVDHMAEDPSRTGPSVLRHVEQTMVVASRSGLGIDDQFELAAIVDNYVFGHAIRTYHGVGFGPEGDPAGRIDAMSAYLTEQLSTGDYPHLEEIAGDDPAAAFARMAHLASEEDRFERGLQRVLDGLELWIDREGRA